VTKKMTKDDLISEIAEATELDAKQVSSALYALAQISYREAANGFTIPGICTLTVVQSNDNETGKRDSLTITPIGAAVNAITPNSPPDISSTKMTTPESDEGSIVFACEKCGSMISTPSSSTGKTAECPFCNEDVQIPEVGSNTNINRDSTSNPESTSKPEVAEFVTFFCEGCGQEIVSAKSIAGSTACCQTCGSKVTIPNSSTPPPTPVANNDKNASPSMTMRIDLLDL
jgi:DNA-directed RNA polymerase subunit M/transcription elongation factor TFIIS